VQKPSIRMLKNIVYSILQVSKKAKNLFVELFQIKGIINSMQ